MVGNWTQLGVNAGLTTWNLLTNVFLATKVDSWGRRNLNLIGCGVMLLTFVIWTALSAINANKGNTDSEWKFYLVFVVVLVIETAVVYFFYIETRYVLLEEISKLFDGDGADVVEVASAEVSGKMKLDQTGDATMIEDVANIKA